MRMLSRKRPRPSIENATPAPSTRSANASLVNCLGSSGRRNSTVLKGFHVPPILLDTRLASTCRVAQSITATR